MVQIKRGRGRGYIGGEEERRRDKGAEALKGGSMDIWKQISKEERRTGERN